MMNQPDFRLAVCLVLSLASCAAVQTRYVDSVAAVRGARDNIVASGRLSAASVQLLRLHGMTEETALSKSGPFDPDAFRLEPALKRYYLHSELALTKELKKSRKEPADGLGNYVAAAHYAYRGMLEPECQASTNAMCDNFKLFYTRALLEIIKQLSNSDWKTDEQSLAADDQTRYLLRLARGEGLEEPSRYESILPSAQIGIEGLPNRHLRYGLGISLTACRSKHPEDPADRFLPGKGLCVPLSAVLRFAERATADAPLSAKLELYNSTKSESVSFAGRETALAADFTAPFASLIERTGATKLTGFLSAFDSSERGLAMQGFYCTELVDPTKIPLVTVHGLFSNPFTWIGVQNDLMGDDIIRRNYQIWHYNYPTNLPILENAKTFRTDLEELHQYLKAAGSSKEMVLIAHSMGGLLTKTAVGKDSTPMRELFVDPAALNTLDPAVRAGLDEYVSFSFRGYINRVIFVAVPHRGSEIADNWIGRLGHRLISLPETVISNLTSVVTQAQDVLRPEVASAASSKDLSSIRGLSPKNPVIAALAQVDVAPEVPFHSVIGDRGRGDTPNSSDGIVPYWSSHLPGAQSELIVPANHSAHVHPFAIQEIRRVLHLHLDQPEEEPDFENSR